MGVPGDTAAGGGAGKAQLDREFSHFYREHLRDVYNYTYYRTGNHHDAEDLTTQTFIQAYRHFERAQRESDGRPLRPWLIRIAHNLAANYYRDRKRKPTTSSTTWSWASSHDTEDLVVGREEAVAVLKGVRALPDDRREALIMRFALGMDNREISRTLGRSEGATKVLIHRAIKQLEQELGLEEEKEAMNPQAAAGRSDDRRELRIMRMLEQALAPVDPPASFVDQLESRLADVRGRRARGARGAVGLGAGRDARPAQLGPARGGARRRDGRRAPRWSCSGCAATAAAGHRACAGWPSRAAARLSGAVSSARSLIR